MARRHRNRPGRLGYLARRLGAELLESRLAMDGQLADLLPRFGSSEALSQYLVNDALDQYSSLFGQPAGSQCWEVCYYYDAMFEQRSGGAPSANHASGSGIASTNVSSTNVQVAGVDEGDIVEADEGFLYVLGSRQLAIVEADPADGLAVSSRFDLPGRGVAEFLYGDRLTVITTESFWNDPQPLVKIASSEGLRPLPFVSWHDSVTITVLDVSDRTAPKITEQTNIDGSYRDSRAIDDKVVVIVSNGNLALPAPEQICTDEITDRTWDTVPVADGAVAEGRMSAPMFDFWGGNGNQSCVYETREVWLARMESQVDEFVVEHLPHFTSYGADHEFARAGLLHEPADLVRPVTPHPSQILSVVTFDVNDNDAGVLAAEGIAAGWHGQVYASRDALIVTEPVWNDGILGGSSTRLLLYRWNAETGSPYAASVGIVPGTLLNSFSLDEFQGSVRVATTTNQLSADGNGWETSNQLFVLETVGATMDIVGQLNDFGTDERIQSVRFVGDTAFVVTFRQIDPLFTIDLSVPSKPHLVGELVMPGFSGYLQMLDDTHLLGLGSAPDANNNWVPRLALFDVADLAHPQLLDEYSFRQGSSTIAVWEHHALSWNAEAKVLTLPLEWSEQDSIFTAEDGSSWPTYRQVYALQALHIETAPVASPLKPIRLLGEIQHGSPVLRSATIGDYLYSLSQADLKVLALDTPKTVIDTLDLFEWPEPLPPWNWWNVDVGFGQTRVWDDAPENQTPAEVTPSPLDDQGLNDVVTSAIDDLAKRLNILAPQVRLISAEPAPVPEGSEGMLPAAGFQLVLGVGANRYLYHGDQEHGVTLTDDSFEFRDQPEMSPWHNQHDALDASGDGTIAPQDALLIINELNLGGPRELRSQYPLRAIAAPAIDLAVQWFWDVDGDRFVAPLDALRIINWLNAKQAAVGEGEVGLQFAPLADTPTAACPTAALAEVHSSRVGLAESAWAAAVDYVVQEATSDDPFDAIL